LQRCEGPSAGDVVGRYRCEELQAGLVVAASGGVLYGAFSGFLGEGAMELLEAVGADVWLLPCPRALDQPPPGEWTLVAQRDGANRIVSIVVGCPLARRLVYTRIE
jgi:D-aminopeptidase